ncbi:MAG: hypothetical protein QOG26_80 [Solirubrobacterales bacterium]|jgi:hypothetical protein|nr:hypothetical protein [Solirubrobacterales bacterium]MDX6652708.1 hypothetical protein [Solirubrobacterales bacterium]
MKAIVAFVLLVSAALMFIVTVGGWSRLQGSSVGIMCLLFVAIYVLFAYLVSRWNRGVLPVAAVLGILLLIFSAIAAPGWFDRTGDGFSNPALPEELLGLLTLVLVPVQVILIAVALIAFNQEWHVEEERPVGRSEQYGAGGDGLPEPA